ncbi:hypothetical protein ACYOEI_05355 [Singulisphaera rosea]
MTVQISDKLMNLYSRVNTDGLRLYGVIRGDPRDPSDGWGDGPAFAAKPTPPNESVLCTGLWRRYVATFVLERDGRLKLATFEYLISVREWQREEIDELLEGDFWMVMRPHFNADRIYIPFRESVVIEDRDRWLTEEPYLVRKHRRLERRRQRTARRLKEDQEETGGPET